jgi:hypothetical protein
MIHLDYDVLSNIATFLCDAGMIFAYIGVWVFVIYLLAEEFNRD